MGPLIDKTSSYSLLQGDAGCSGQCAAVICSETEILPTHSLIIYFSPLQSKLTALIRSATITSSRNLYFEELGMHILFRESDL